MNNYIPHSFIIQFKTYPTRPIVTRSYNLQIYSVLYEDFFFFFSFKTKSLFFILIFFCYNGSSTTILKHSNGLYYEYKPLDSSITIIQVIIWWLSSNYLTNKVSQISQQIIFLSNSILKKCACMNRLPWVNSNILTYGSTAQYCCRWTWTTAFSNIS